MSGEGNDPRVCPRCNNLSVQPAKKREWFELFCVPVIPYSSDHVWHCGICNWEVSRNGGFQPMAPGQFQQPQYHMQPGYGGPPPQGYGQQQNMHVPQNYQGPKV